MSLNCDSSCLRSTDYITALALSRSHAEIQARFHPHPKCDSPKRLQPSLIPDLCFEPTYLARLEAAGPGWWSIIPLIQGALWCIACRMPNLLDVLFCRATAPVFIQPLLRHLTGWQSQRYAPQPAKEGRAAGWLRQLACSLFPDARSGNLSGSR